MEETTHALVKVEVLVRNGTQQKLYFVRAGDKAVIDVIDEVKKQYRDKIVDLFHVERIGTVKVLG